MININQTEQADFRTSVPPAVAQAVRISVR